MMKQFGSGMRWFCRPSRNGLGAVTGAVNVVMSSSPGTGCPPWRSPPRGSRGPRGLQGGRGGAGRHLLGARVARPYGVAAELVAERGDYLGGEGLLLAGDEPRQQRERDHRRGHVAVDRLEHRPAPFA